MNPNELNARINACVNGIMSADNSCGTLKCMVEKGGDGLRNFLASRIAPTLQVYEAEAEQLRADRAEASQKEEAKRQVLEYIAANALSLSSGQIQELVLKALGRG